MTKAVDLHFKEELPRVVAVINLMVLGKYMLQQIQAIKMGLVITFQKAMSL